MYNKLIFYNQWGNGDIFESREFVKECMNIIPAKEYYYAHNKNPRILKDIPELKFTHLTYDMNPRLQIMRTTTGACLINTWIGITGKYLLPGIGCTVEGLHRMYNDILLALGLGKLKNNPIDYIPEINYSFYEIDKVNQFITQHPEEKIFIDNGTVLSKQAENFPFDFIIESVARNHLDKCFITSQAGIINSPNVYSIVEIVDGTKLGFDLNELSYLSTFCSTLIGRNSGPHVFTQVKENVMNENKKLLSFTYTKEGSSFVVNTPVAIRKYWSNAIDDIGVIKGIEEILHV